MTGHVEPLLLHGGAAVKALSVAFLSDFERHWRKHGGKLLESLERRRRDRGQMEITRHHDSRNRPPQDKRDRLPCGVVAANMPAQAAVAIATLTAAAS